MNSEPTLGRVAQPTLGRVAQPTLGRVAKSRRIAASILRSRSGFTLLEVMIAVAIMLVAFSSILMVQSSSINTSIKTRQMVTVSMLAKNIMIESEQAWEGKTFDEFKKEDGDTFKPPFEEYKWKRVVKEVKFPNFSTGGGQEGEKSSAASNAGGGDGQTDQAAQLARMMTNFLNKAVREVTVTVSWKKGDGEQSYSIATYWVNLNNEFQISEQ